MATMSVKVTAQWALAGKEADDYEYRLLRCSDGTIGAAEFGEILTRYATGPLEELPQVAFSWLVSKGSFFAAIIFHEIGDIPRRDRSGRPIVFSRLFCVPYFQLADGGVSYRAFHKAFRNINQAAGNSAPATVDIPVSPPAAVRNEQARWVAALLLTTRRVCILGAERVSLARRLAFVDDVMALLPYGMRSQMSTATWTSSSFREHKFRLFFQSAPRENSDDHIVRWDQLDDAPLKEAHAQEYLSWLTASANAAESLVTQTMPTRFNKLEILGLVERAMELNPLAPESPKGHVFISYVHEDAGHVDWIQGRLEEAGVRVWRDTAELWPGEYWRSAIRRAIQDDALVFLACFSRQSLAKPKSYQNAELDLAIEQLQLRRPDQPWLIPVRFDDCDIPDRDIGASRTLASIQRADLFGEQADKGADRLVAAVLRILGNDAGTAAPPVSSRVAPRLASRPAPPAAHASLALPGPAAGSAVDKDALAVQLLGFLQRSPDEVSKGWRAATDQRREETLSVLLGQRDGAAFQALASRWEIVAPDAEKLISSELWAGRNEIAAGCLDALASAGSDGAEDHLLGYLLIPSRNDEPGKRLLYFESVLELLQDRAVPVPDTYRYCCDRLRSGGPGGWPAFLVSHLLCREAESARDSARVARWLDWLCRTPYRPATGTPEWVEALLVFTSQPSDQAVASLRGLMSTGFHWTDVIMSLAQATNRLPEVLAAADLSLAELIVQGVNSGGLPNDGWGARVRGTLQVSLWKKGLAPAHVAAADVIRVLLGSNPESLPADSIEWYVAGLQRVLALEAMKLARDGVARKILDHATGRGLSFNAQAIELLNAFSADENLIPGLMAFIIDLPVSRRPYSENLSESFWVCLAADERLSGYPSVSRLLAATKEVVRDTAAALRRTIGESGLSNTDLALACYHARLAGLPLKEILRAMAEEGISQVPVGSLDDVLREFQTLLDHRHGVPARGAPEGAVVMRRTQEPDLVRCYQRIIEGAFGDEYGLAFKEHATARLDEEAKASRRLRRNLRWRYRFVGVLWRKWKRAVGPKYYDRRPQAKAMTLEERRAE